MSAPVNVLAVLELAAGDLLVAQDAFDAGNRLAGLDKASARLTEALAVVTDLIEALNEIAASRIEATGSPPVPYLTAEQAWNTARAALAGVIA